MGKMSFTQNILVGKPERTRPFGRHRHVWEHIKTNGPIKEIGPEDMDWIKRAQVRVCFEHSNKASDSIKGGVPLQHPIECQLSALTRDLKFLRR
jgi:hypothetical protein